MGLMSVMADIWRSRSRSALTMSAVAIGIFSVTVISAAGQIGTAKINDSLDDMGVNSVLVEAQEAGVALSDSDIDALGGLSGVNGAMPLMAQVENAIQYGLGKDEKITIRIFEDNRRGLAAITIADSGNGLTIEEINQINAPFDYNLQKMQNGNRGIGLRYVKAMLDSFYEGQTNLFVNCKKGHGTKITILIPVQEELRDKAKVTDTGIE